MEKTKKENEELKTNIKKWQEKAKENDKKAKE